MNAPRKQKIMVVAAGSGGHVFPALAFCQECRDRYQGAADIVFVTSEASSVPFPVPVEFHPEFLKVRRTPGGIIRLLFKSLSLIARVQPDIVLGFGGYVSVPFVLGAKLLGKKAFIHEQNVVPGRANRFLSGFADKVIVSFKDSEKYFKRHKKKIVWARYPLRSSVRRVPREEALRFFGFESGFFTVLVVGGSQGAHALNERFLAALKENRNLGRMQVLHLTGPGDAAMAREAYQALPVRSRVFDFLSEMNYAYASADLVIGRSGAGCVAEILYFGLPSILVPYPYAGAHQMENARVPAEKGASILLEEGKMTPGITNGLLDIFIDDAMRRKTMSSIAVSLYESSQGRELSEVVFKGAHNL